MTTAPARSRSDTPQVTRSRFVAALNAGDFHGATSCFARNGRLFPAGAGAIRGREAIGAFLAQSIDLRIEVEVESSETFRAGDFFELASERWRIHSGGKMPWAFAPESNATLVLHSLEGAWRFSIVALEPRRPLQPHWNTDSEGGSS